MAPSLALFVTFIHSLAPHQVAGQLLRTHLLEWFYADLVGIRPDPTGVAFSKSIIQPRLMPGVTWANATSDSARGRISCLWRINGPRFHMEVTVPANTTSTIYVPSRFGSPVRIFYPESKSVGFFANQQLHDNVQPIQVKSGRYVFDSLIR